MRFGRRRPPLLAEIPDAPREGAAPGALSGAEMDAFGEVLGRLGGARTVLATGEADAGGTVALGLATTAVAQGRRAVLVECDLAHPRLAESLGLATAPGLVEYLRGEAEARALLEPVVLAGPAAAAALDPLVCVVAGRPVAEPWGLLASGSLRRALANVGEAYELTVVAAPSLRHPHSLAPLLPQVEATIACVSRANRRRRLPVAVSGIVVQG